MARNAGLDNPAEHPEEDEFNRWPFCQRLAETIARFDTSQGAPVLGLFGRWGYGKSTVLNFLRIALERSFGDQVTVFPFNPWLFKDQDALLREFFVGLARSIDTELEKSGQRVGELMERYGGALSSVPFVGGGLSKTIEAMGKDLSNDPTSSQRDRLTDIMRNSPKKVVVLIDDLDRLDRDEIMTMLKMVRLSANFPNVIYLLAFDEERVARAAGQTYGDAAEGRQFLEKIIQYPFTLPAVASEKLAAYVLRHAKTACHEAGVQLSESAWTEYHRACKDVLLIQLTTPRQAIRYANALRFALPILKGEVDPFDQMIVEAARILFPTTYNFIRDHVDFNGRQSTHIAPLELEAAESLIRILSRHDRETRKPVYDPRYHERYFSYAVAPDDLSDAELEQLLELCKSNEDKALNDKVHALAQTRLTTLLDRLEVLIDRMSLEGARRMAVALALSGAVLSRPIHDQASALKMANVIARFALHYLPLQQQRSRLLIAPEVIRNATPLPFAMRIYYALGNIEIPFSRTERISPQEWEQFQTILCERIKLSAARVPLYDEYLADDAIDLLLFWNSFASTDQINWLEKRLEQHPDEVSKFLDLFVDKTAQYDMITKLIDPSVAIRAIRARFGEALDEGGNQGSPELAGANSFLYAHHQARPTDQ
jgi:hypothetical protein